MRLRETLTPLRGGGQLAVACPPAKPAQAQAPTGHLPEDGRRPDPELVLPALARLVTEVLAGRRSLGQVAPMMTPAVVTRLAARIRGQYRSDSVPTDRVSVRHAAACWVNDTACEGVVTVHDGRRTTALAIRIEHHAGRWRVAEVAGPEFELAPLGPTRRPSRGQDEDAAAIGADPWEDAAVASA
jgi:hypothetical protein